MNSATDSKPQYYSDKVVPEGSNLYYSYLFARKELKHKFIVLHAFANELGNIITDCSDPGVARIKFNWWLEELDRYQRQQPRHPLTQEMSTLFNSNELDIRQLQNTVSQYEKLIQLSQPETLADSIALFQHCEGMIWQMNARIAGIKDDNTLYKAGMLGAIYQYFCCLQKPMTYLVDERCVMPRDYLSLSLLEGRFDSFSKDSPHTKNFSAMLKEITSICHEANSSFTKFEKRKFLHGFILTRIALATMSEMSATQFLSSSISLTPIRKILIAGLCRIAL